MNHPTPTGTVIPRVLRPMHFIALAALVFATAPAAATDPATLANSGGEGIAPCASCHAKDGGGMASFPRLAGMDAAYLEKQLRDFGSGSRDNAVMKPISDALSPEDQAAIAAYYAKMPVPASLAQPEKPSTADESLGARLALQGKWSDNVPGCVQCHGPRGLGVGEHFPAIAGQPAVYISTQLKAFKDGTRKNDPLELMRHLPAGLSDEEVTAVSQWFAGVPVVPVTQTVSAGDPS